MEGAFAFASSVDAVSPKGGSAVLRAEALQSIVLVLVYGAANAAGECMVRIARVCVVGGRCDGWQVV